MWQAQGQSLLRLFLVTSLPPSDECHASFYPILLQPEGLCPASRWAEALGLRYEDRLRGLSVERCINGFHLNAASY